MVIKIDKSIKTGWAKGKVAKKIIKDALFKIALSYKENRHIVYGEKETINFLYEEYKKISEKSFITEVLNKIKRDIHFLTSATKKVGFYMKVVFDDTIPNERFDNHTSNPQTMGEHMVVNLDYIIVNLHKLDNFDLFMNETMLLVENPLDADFYAKVVDKYRSKNNFIKFSHHFFPFNGGGSAIKDCYELFANKPKYMCIAVADKDCKYKGYVIGNSVTHKGIIKIDTDNSKPFNCNYLVIGVRDIENLIPLELVQIEKPNQVNAISSIIQNDTLKKEQIIVYFDYKNGIKQNSANPNQEKIQELDSWKSVFGNNYLQNQCNTNNSTTTYVEGFGNNILGKTINHINNSINLNSNLLETEWEEIGKFIFSYCCTLKSSNQIPNF